LYNNTQQGLPFSRTLVISLTKCRSELYPKVVNLGSVVDKKVLLQVSTEYFGFLLSVPIPQWALFFYLLPILHNV